jgi:hypothetical protein
MREDCGRGRIHLLRHIRRIGIRGRRGASLCNSLELAVAAMRITLYILVIVA